MFLLQRAFGQESLGFVFVFLKKLIGLKTCIQSKFHLFLCCFIEVTEKYIIGETVGTSYMKHVFCFLVEDFQFSVV